MPMKPFPGKDLPALTEKLSRLELLAPKSFRAIGVLVDLALKESSPDFPGAQQPYVWRCDEPSVTKKGGS